MTDLRRRVVGLAWAGAAGVVFYVSSWAVAGVWRADFDPVEQSISSLFAQGAPPGPSLLVAASLAVTGILLVPFSWALHRGLPGRSLAGPVTSALGGVATALIVVFPCSPGCPGFGTTLTDTMHTIVAGVGYAALVVTPLLFAPRLWGRAPRLAVASVVLGGLSVVGFVLHSAGLVSGYEGLLQRVFNTLADAWYVLAAVAVTRYVGQPDSA